MRGKQRKGASLGMVIITTIVLSILLVIIATIVDTGTAQTARVYRQLQAKYVATSGAQLALGAYFGDENATTPTALYAQFARRANRTDRTPIEVKSTHRFTDGDAEVTMTGAFENGNTANDYYITVVSKAKIKDSSGNNYVHEVKFSQTTSGIRSEKGYIE